MLCLAIAMAAMVVMAQEKKRGLWACKSIDEKKVFVSWRMRGTDDPLNTTYKLYANDKLVKTLHDRTNAALATSYASATFRLEVLNADGTIIDSQDDVKCDAKFFHHVKLDYPGDYTMKDGTAVTYTPGDCSSYDMDGDGHLDDIHTNYRDHDREDHYILGDYDLI